jgi:hypothetical protein
MKPVALPAATANCIRMLHDGALAGDAARASVVLRALNAARTELAAILVTGQQAYRAGGGQDIKWEYRSL